MRKKVYRLLARTPSVDRLEENLSAAGSILNALGRLSPYNPQCYAVGMFRRARWFILLAILAIIGSVTSVFIIQRRAMRRQRPKISAPLADNTLATAERWKYELTSGDKAKIVIYARRFEQIK